jgi:hypothetical protein
LLAYDDVPNKLPVNEVAVTLPFTFIEPEEANEPVNEIVSTLADNTVPLPVIETDPVTPKDPVI